MDRNLCASSARTPDGCGVPVKVVGQQEAVDVELVGAQKVVAVGELEVHHYKVAVVNVASG